MKTRLLYLDDMNQLSGQAQVLEIIPQDGLTILVLDQTVFYPQGGGQPADKGTIKNDKGHFDVSGVFVENDTVYHKGTFAHGLFEVGDTVALEVDHALRVLHNKNHTAGHLIDYALHELGYPLVAGKAYHFPQGPYVEYQGTLDQDVREKLKVDVEKMVNEFVQQGLPVSITLQQNDPRKRSMIVNGYAPILCGGTHVLNTKDIGHITIRKVKNEKGNLRVSYAVD